MGVERYGSKTDVVVKLVLVFFIALLSFSIGTFVGKKFSDNEYARKQMEPGHTQKTAEHGSSEEHGEEARGVASIHPDLNEVKPEKALSDEEIAKLAEEFVADDEKPREMEKSERPAADHAANNAHGASSPTAQRSADPHAAPVAGHSRTPTAPAAAPSREASREALKPAARLAEGKSPVLPNPPESVPRIPSALPTEVASSAIGKYTVQVASYQSEKEAQTMAGELKSKGFSAFYVSAKVKGKTYYRVSVGLFTTPKEADDYKNDLAKRGKVSGAIVQKITSTN